MLRISVAAVVFLSALWPALADGEVGKIMTPADNLRLKNYESVRMEALGEAKAGGDPGELAALEQTLAKPTLPINDADLTGNWKCRTTKLGNLSPLVVYSWFKCRVTDDGSGWMLEKLSCSQRTKGRFYTDSETRLIYLGGGYVNDDPAPPYGQGPKSDEAGYAFLTGKNEWRIEFPSPYYESKLDILELKR